MKIKAVSKFSSKTHEWDLPVSQRQIDKWVNKMGLVQDIFNNLTSEQREFLMTGVTPDEWNEEFKPRTWQEMAERTDMLKPGVKVKAGGKEFTVLENGLNELGCAVIVKDEYSEELSFPGPKNYDSPEWYTKASFELIPEKRDESLGIKQID